MKKSTIIIASIVSIIIVLTIIGLVIFSHRLIDRINDKIISQRELSAEAKLATEGHEHDQLESLVVKDDCCQDLSEAKNEVEHLSQSLKQLKDENRKLNIETEKYSEYEMAWLRKERKLNENIKSLNDQLSRLENNLILNDELIAELQDIIMQQIGHESEYPSRSLGPKVMTEPNNYFRDYIEIIAPDTYVKRAVFRTDREEIVFIDPIVINTSSLRSGLYYVSFYDKENNLIQAAKPMYRR